MENYLPHFRLYLLLFFPVAVQAQDGPLYRSTDNGQSWHPWSVGLSAAKRIDRILPDDQLIYALSENQGLFRSTDGGKQWGRPGFSLFLPKKIDVLHKQASMLYAGTYQEGVYVSADQGSSWVAMNRGLNDLTIRAFHTLGEAIWVGTNDGLYLWNANSRQWQHQLKGVQVNAMAQAGDRFWVATHQGLQQSTNAGQTWEVVLDQGAIKQLYTFEGQVYACSMRKEVWKYQPKSRSWVEVTKDFPTEGYSSSILYLDKEVIYVAQGKQLYRKKPNQNQWEEVKLSSPQTLYYRDLKMLQPGVLLLACTTE